VWLCMKYEILEMLKCMSSKDLGQLGLNIKRDFSIISPV
jgi:hypothetical protein